MVAGFALYGGPRGPDAPQTWWQVGGAGLLLAAFGLSAHAAGWIAGRRVFRTAPVFVLDLGLGLGLLALWAQVVGLLGGLAYFPSPWLSPVFALPLLAARDGRWPGPRPRLRLSPPLLLLGLTFLLLFLVACIPDPMPDPLWYHLTSARWWMDAGKIYFPRENVALLAAGGWDALYLWPTHFLGSPGGGGLIAAHIAGQWLHLLGGGLGTALALRLFFGRVFPRLRADWLWLAVLAAALSASQQATIFLAKNDWGASLWLLCALLALPGHALLAGMFWGLALSAKLTALFIGVPLLLWRVGPRRRTWAAVLGGAALGSAPWAIRNYAFTGNPFFPVFSRWLRHADLADVWRRTAGYDGGAFLSLAHREFLAKLALADTPFLALTILAAALVWRRARWRREAGFCLLVTAAGVFLLLKLGPQSEYRLFGLGCLLAAGSGLAFFLSRLEERPWCAPGSWIRSGISGAVFLVAAFSTSYPWRAALDLRRAPSPPEVIRRHFGGTAQAWVRLNVPEGAGVAGANEARLYYLSAYRAYRVWDHLALDRELRRARSLAEAVARMQAAGIRYLLFTRLDWDRYFRKDILDALEAAWARHRDTVVFDTDNSKVIDLRRMAEALRENDVALPRRDW